MKLTPNAQRVLEVRYLRRDARGRVAETPEQLFDRVARAVGAAGQRCDGEDASGDYRQLLASLDFLPNSPTLMNAGQPGGQLSACFVLPIEDTMEGIFEAVKRMALIQRTGGGTGFDFSRLRPRGDIVRSTGGQASGPVSFLRIFDSATEHIKQGGRRRGANMGILRVDHPDILEFVDLKREPGTARNFNLSVGVTDAFMAAAEGGGEIALLHPGTRAAAARMPAADLFDAICQAAWECGDPGLIFLDTINRANPTPALGEIAATNPCGEIPLLPYEACNLGSVNLAAMLTGGDVDWDKLKRTVHLAVRFLDDVIEASSFPFPEIADRVRGNRKIGLGVMGFADLLIELGIPYDSGEAVEFAGKLMRFIGEEAFSASAKLAETRGPFPNWPGSVFAKSGTPLRNATRTAIAPTGTLSIIAGASAGIEPLFALAYHRRALDGEVLREIHPGFLERAGRLGAPGEKLVEAVRQHGSLRGIDAAPEDLRRLFATALEIAPESHLQIQAAFQQHVDNSVSKTVNLPNEATPGDVARIYREAWKMGLKGITVFRYGSKPTQVLEMGVREDCHL